MLLCFCVGGGVGRLLLVSSIVIIVIVVVACADFRHQVRIARDCAQSTGVISAAGCHNLLSHLFDKPQRRHARGARQHCKFDLGALGGVRHYTVLDRPGAGDVQAVSGDLHRVLKAYGRDRCQSSGVCDGERCQHFRVAHAEKGQRGGGRVRLGALIVLRRASVVDLGRPHRVVAHAAADCRRAGRCHPPSLNEEVVAGGHAGIHFVGPDVHAKIGVGGQQGVGLIDLHRGG
mmetsp:Transcript_39116/g.83257  ORF Transcript_39116/g.83257 Transcript_39116/m.83257 type:complete len:232 (-) Transcript_39116:2057-2752(-)